MNKNEISKALTKGLLAGYREKTMFDKTNRGSFEVTSSHFEDGEIIYHDEWTNGGGQEIVKFNDEMFTRVYAGGTVNEEELSLIGVTHKDVILNLISRIQELGDKTRLFENCLAENRNDWDYEYKILDNDQNVEVATGKEVIKYKGQVVFVHIFVLAPIN